MKLGNVAVGIGLAISGVVWAQSEPNWCNPEPKICLWASTIDELSVLFRLEGPKEAGYVAIGLGKGMDEADIFVMWRDENEVQLEYRTSEGYTMPQLSDDTGLDLLYADTLSTKMSATFMRNFSTTSSLIEISPEASTSFIWAYSEYKPSGNSIQRHSKKGTFQIKITEALEGTILEPESDSSSEPIPTAIVAHGIIMMIAWVGLPPIGVFVARYMKGILGVWWFRTHILVFLLVGVLSLTGVFLIALFLGFVVNGPHAVIGVLVISLYSFQIILGVIIDRMYSSTRTSIPGRDQLHWWVGRTTAGLGVLNVILGISMIPFEYCLGWWLAFAFLILFNLLLFGIAPSRLSKRSEIIPPSSSQANLISHTHSNSSHVAMAPIP